jgi:hypothetical protein
MPNSNQQIDSAVQSFVTEISNLVRLAALEAVHAALGGGAAPVRRGPGRPRGSGKRGPGRPKGSRNAAKAMPARAARGGKRGRRSSEDVDATAAKFLAFVKANDGKRLEEIAKGLKLPTSVLKLPAQKLLAAKAVRTTGQRRGTKYHVASGSMPKPEAAAPAKATPTTKRAKKA